MAELESRDTTRIIAPKPEPGPLSRSLTKATREERAALKAGALAERAPSAILRDGLEIVLLREPVVRPDGALEVWLEAKRDGKPIAVDNPYLFVNPPVMVPDGTYRLEDVEQFGKRVQVEVENFHEDPDEALRIVLADAVRGRR